MAGDTALGRMGLTGRWAWPTDVVLALILAGAAFGVDLLRPANAVDLASLILVLAAVAGRRAWPRAAWGLGLAGGVLQLVGGLSGLVAVAGLLLVVYGVTAYGPRALVLLTGAVIPVAAAAGIVSLIEHRTTLDQISADVFHPQLPGGLLANAAVLYLFALAPLAAAFLAGLARRSVTAAQQASAREGLAAADSARAAQVATLQQQRAELAREVHDVVGHSLAVIIAQADSVRFRATDSSDQSEQAQAAVAAIAATARSSLEEIREVLTRLGRSRPSPSLTADPDAAGPGSTGSGAGGSGAAELLAGSDALPELFARVRQAGVPLTVQHAGQPADAGPAERAALVAIIREMLTNALRHGDRAAAISVDLDWSAAGVRVRVLNRAGAGDGTGPGAGQGLPGMRARLDEVGGQLGTSREPRPDGGHDFVVTAWVPSTAAGPGEPLVPMGQAGSVGWPQ